MSPAQSKQLSDLFLNWGSGDKETLNAILPLIYNELRRLARYHLRQQRPNHTLQTTALVHEAYLRLAREKSLVVENRTHFLGVAGQLMRWILVDYERKRRTAKRGAGATSLSLDGPLAASQLGAPEIDLLALDSALDKLAKLDEQQSRIIELRYFAGFSIEDTAEYLGISPATVKRSWTSARAWLLREMKQEEVHSMNPEEWQRVRALLETSLEMEPAERSRFLNEVCPSGPLRHEVDSLIEVHEQSGTDVLSSPAIAGLVAAEDSEFRLRPGQRVGAYEILAEK